MELTSLRVHICRIFSPLDEVQTILRCSIRRWDVQIIVRHSSHSKEKIEIEYIWGVQMTDATSWTSARKTQKKFSSTGSSGGHRKFRWPLTGSSEALVLGIFSVRCWVKWRKSSTIRCSDGLKDKHWSIIQRACQGHSSCAFRIGCSSDPSEHCTGAMMSALQCTSRQIFSIENSHAPSDYSIGYFDGYHLSC